jgi:hypothetical protein
MEKRFIVESKTFVFSILDGASRLRVGEKRRTFSGEIVINSRCSEWLALTMETYWITRKIKSSSNPSGKGRKSWSLEEVVTKLAVS